MSGRAAAIIAVMALAGGLASEHLLHSWEQPVWIPIFALAVGWITIGSGLVASVARPRQVAGKRLVLAGFLWFGVQQPDYPVLDWIGFATNTYSDLVLLLIGLSFGDRWPARREERIVLVVVAVAFVVESAVRLVARSPEVFDVAIDQSAWYSLVGWANIVKCAMLLVGCAAITRRWFLASDSARFYLGPVLAGCAATAAAGAVYAFYPLGQLGFIPKLSDDQDIVLFWVLNVVRILVPVGILIGILRQRATRSAVAGAIARIATGSASLTLRDALREALGDPALRVLVWDAGHGGYWDEEGMMADAAVRLPGREVAEVAAADGSPLALLAHDPTLGEDPGLVAAGVALTRLVVDNGRLTDEVNRQLDEVRASRARIVEAGDAERRRIERDLHDGVQQRLLALALSLRRAGTQTTADPVAAAALARGADEALGVVADVRELAQGIHPAVLTEAGLAAALRALADRSPVPVDLELDLDGASPPGAAETAYFVASEALANVVKHASASSARLRAAERDGTIRIVVEDDGRGGADPRGSGLRGLDDRLAAVGGSLSVTARPGGGTIVSASIPLA